MFSLETRNHFATDSLTAGDVGVSMYTLLEAALYCRELRFRVWLAPTISLLSESIKVKDKGKRKEQMPRNMAKAQFLSNKTTV